MNKTIPRRLYTLKKKKYIYSFSFISYGGMLLPYKYTSWVLLKHFLLKSKHPIKYLFRKIWAESIKNINKDLQLLLDFSQKQKPIQDYYTSLSLTLCIYEAAESSIFLEISEDLFRIEISHFYWFIIVPCR